MFKKANKILILCLFSACADTPSEITQLQNDYLNREIHETIEQIIAVVESTGYTEYGKETLHHAENLSIKFDSIEREIQKGNLSIETQIEAFIAFAISFLKRPDQLNREYLLASIKQLNPENSKQFSISLRLFTLKTFQSYLTQYENLYFKFDWIEPVVIPNQSSYQVGDNYRAEIVLKAANAGTKPSMQVNFPGDEHGYFEIPVHDTGVGDLKLKNLRKGTKIINLRVILWNSGKQDTLHHQINIEVN